jgi:hypothetical protein
MTPTTLQKNIRYVFYQHLGGDPRQISASHDFVRSTFSLRDGTKVTGRQLLYAVASLEKPKATRAEEMVRELGGPAAVAEIVRRKYLGIRQPGEEVAIGIGTSSKRMEWYLKELDYQGVKAVVDIRARPLSQYFPHFNRTSLERALESQDINYIWLGDLLGNPANERGERTLEGFRVYMGSSSYKQGIQQLIGIAKAYPKALAVTCSEGNEEECHRKFVLQDLGKRVPK